jgi:hypothetical protein
LFHVNAHLPLLAINAMGNSNRHNQRRHCVAIDDGSHAMEFDQSFFGDLPEDLRLGIEQAETPEDLVALAKENGIDLSGEQLDQLAGGVSWGNGTTCSQCGSSNIIKIDPNPLDRAYRRMDCGKQMPIAW